MSVRSKAGGVGVLLLENVHAPPDAACRVLQHLTYTLVLRRAHPSNCCRCHTA